MPTIINASSRVNHLTGIVPETVQVRYTAVFSSLETHLAQHGLVFVLLVRGTAVDGPDRHSAELYREVLTGRQLPESGRSLRYEPSEPIEFTLRPQFRIGQHVSLRLSIIPRGLPESAVQDAGTVIDEP